MPHLEFMALEQVRISYLNVVITTAGITLYMPWVMALVEPGEVYLTLPAGGWPPH